MSEETVDVGADVSLAQAKKSAPYFKKLMTGMDMGGAGSVRTAEYKGHHIVIKTTYQVTIDGKRFMGQLGVTNSGEVHYHGVPNAGFASAIDLVKAVIDTFPDEFAPGSGPGMTMPHGSSHGMTMPRTVKKKKRSSSKSRRRR
jgi:hypothetical protein